jgi:hypothetical protein
MDGVVGVECRAPKAGALPGCATPRHEVNIHFKALSDFLLPLFMLLRGLDRAITVQDRVDLLDRAQSTHVLNR